MRKRRKAWIFMGVLAVPVTALVLAAAHFLNFSNTSLVEIPPGQALERIKSELPNAALPTSFYPVSAVGGGAGIPGETYISIVAQAPSVDIKKYLTEIRAKESHRFNLQCDKQPDKSQYRVYHPNIKADDPQWMQAFNICDEIIWWTIPASDNPLISLVIFSRASIMNSSQDTPEKFIISFSQG